MRATTAGPALGSGSSGYLISGATPASRFGDGIIHVAAAAWIGRRSLEMVDGRDGQALLDETLRLVDRAGWALSGQQMVTAATAEASVLSAATALRDVGAAAAGAPLAAAPLNPRADLAAATRLCQQLPADLAEHGAVLAAAAHLRQAERLLRGQ